MSDSINDHSLTVDYSATPSRIEYSPVFNVAVHMIDRHLAEHRGGYPVIINADVDANVEELKGAFTKKRKGVEELKDTAKYKQINS